MKINLRILLVEDNPHDAKLIKLELEKSFSTSIIRVETEDEFEKQLLTSSPEIILSDYSLPTFNGMEALKIHQKFAINIPFILVTGSMNEETAVKVMKAGADDYVIKENLGRLVPSIKSALEKKAIFKAKIEAEVALKESERRFRTIIEMSSDGILIVDKDRTILFLNSQAENLLATEMGNLVGQKYEDKLGLGESYEKNIVDKNGNTGVVEVNVNEIDWNDEKVHLVTLHNITERKRAENIIYTERELLRMVLDNVPYAIYTKDKEGRKTLANRADLNSLGYSFEEEIIGKTDYDLYPKEIAEKHLLDDKLVMNEGAVINDKEELIIDDHGNQRWYLTTKLPCYNDKQEIIGLLGISKDITESRLILNALKESEERYRILLENSGVGMGLYNLDGQILMLNQKATEDLGISNKNNIGKNLIEIFGNEYGEEILQRIQTTAETSKTLEFEDHLKLPVGNRWFHTNFTRIQNATGDVTGVQILAQDITERKLAEKALIESYQFNNSILQTIPFGMDIVDEFGNILFMSQKFQMMFDSDNIGKKCWEIYRDDKTQCMDCPLHYEIKLGEIGVTIAEGVLNKKTFQINHTGLMFEGKKAVLEIFQDITDRVRVEKELRESEERFHQLFLSSPDAIMLLDISDDKISWPIIDCNDAACKMNGYTREELIGKSVDIININSGTIEERSDYLERIRKEGTLHLEAFHKHKDGHIFPIEVSTSIVKFKGREHVLGIDRDITERKRAEEILRESERKLREAQKMAHLGFWSWNINTGEVEWSEEVYKIFGKDPKEYIPKIDSILELSPWPVYHQRDEELINRVLKDHRTGGYEQKFLRPDQSVGYYYSTFQGNYDEENNLISIVGTILDITERKKIEEELKVSEERFRSIYENATIGIYRTTPDGKLEIANPALIKMLGYDSFGELLQQNLNGEELGTGYSYKDFQSLYGDTDLETGVELAWIKKDSTTIYVRQSTRAIYDENNNPIYYDGIVEDITKRKQAENQIRLLAHSIRSISECVSITDEHDKILFVNDAFLKTYGYTEDELIGKHIGIVRSKREMFEQARQILPQTISGGWKGEIINCKKDGTEFPIALSTSIIRNEKNEPVALVGVAIDITDIKKAREELILAKEKAEKSDKLKTEFLAQMSHEIRSPMHAILSFSNLAKEELGEKLSPELSSYFLGIETAGRRLIRTVDLILNTSEMQLGTYEPIIIKFDLIGQVLKHLYNEYSGTAKDKGLEFVFTSSLKVANIKADLYSITQIFMHLIDNAIKYTVEGKVEIKLSKTPVDGIEVTIQDTGIGMSKEFMETIFQPFMQEERGYSRKFEGNGLGLVLVKYYCDMHRAKISVTSEKGVGSKFLITFLPDK